VEACNYCTWRPVITLSTCSRAHANHFKNDGGVPTNGTAFGGVKVWTRGASAIYGACPAIPCAAYASQQQAGHALLPVAVSLARPTPRDCHNETHTLSAAVQQLPCAARNGVLAFHMCHDAEISRSSALTLACCCQSATTSFFLSRRANNYSLRRKRITICNRVGIVVLQLTTRGLV
jgi:hypothetical protein